MTLKEVSRYAGCSTPETRAAAIHLYGDRAQYTGAQAEKIADLARAYRRQNRMSFIEKLEEKYKTELLQVEQNTIRALETLVLDVYKREATIADEVYARLTAEEKKAVDLAKDIVADIESLAAKLQTHLLAEVAKLQAKQAALQQAAPAAANAVEAAPAAAPGSAPADGPALPANADEGKIIEHDFSQKVEVQPGESVQAPGVEGDLPAGTTIEPVAETAEPTETPQQ
jgi:hypothetical protein